MNINTTDRGAIGCIALCGVMLILLDIWIRSGSSFIGNIRICGLLSIPMWLFGLLFILGALYKLVESQPNTIVVPPTNSSSAARASSSNQFTVFTGDETQTSKEVEKLLHDLRDVGISDIRRSAAEQLGRIGIRNEHVLTALQTAAQSDINEAVRRAAEDALRSLGRET